MRSTVRDGLAVLSEDGPVTFLRESLSFVYQTVYWSVNDSYTLAVDDAEVIFSAPNRTAVNRNKRRFRSEKLELTDIVERIRPDDVFFDVGANTGLYSLFVAKSEPSADVVAFEPYPPNAETLQRDTERNGLANVDIRAIALSDSEGTTVFDQPNDDDVGYGSGSIAADQSEPGERVSVQTAPGDSLIANGSVPAPNVVKIDVEGAEPLVVEGLSDAFSRSDCRVVYCEIHRSDVAHRPSIDDFGMTLEDMKSCFRGFGFEVEELQTRGDEVFLKAEK
jgi:FkbM family methyltransferase